MSTDSELLGRIDERTEHLVHDVDVIKKKLDTQYVTKEAFDPIRRLVYGAVGVVLLSFAATAYSVVTNGSANSAPTSKTVGSK